MTQPVFRPTVQTTLQDLVKRVRALEAVPASRAGGELLIAGSVFNDGTVILPAGPTPGFSVVWTTSGSTAVPDNYDLTFDSPLLVIPVIQLTPNNNNQPPTSTAGTYQASIKNGTPATTGFSVLTFSFDPAATSNDGGWDFACFTPGVPGV